MTDGVINVASKRVVVTLSLAGILVLALILRLWGINFGLPYVYHFDEPTYVSAALNLGVGIIGRQPNPTGFSNILFGEYATYFVLGQLAGLFSSTADFELAYRADTSIFILLGRLTSMTFGTLNILAVYWLGREIHGQTVGLLAALFLAAAFLHVRDSHYSVPDVAMTSFATISVFTCVYAMQSRHRWSLYIAAIAGGFATAIKWTAWPITVPIAIAFFYLRSSTKESLKRTRAVFLDALIILIAFLVGFLPGGFQLFLRPMTFISYALHELRSGDAGGFGIWQVDTVSGWVFYLKTLVYGLGIVILTLGMIGVVSCLLIALRKKDWTRFVVLTFPVLYYLLMGTTRHYFARYALPLVPFMTLFAAETAVIVSTWLRSRWVRLAQGITIVLILASVTQPLVSSIRHDILLTKQDTRTLAKQWIEANIPEGKKIAVEWPVHGPPWSTSQGWMPDSDKVYDVTIIGGEGLSEKPVAWYWDQGFDYLIASSFIYRIPLVYEQRDAERRTFYAELDKELDVVQVFRPSGDDREPPFIFDEIYGPAISLWQRERPGPTLKIYQVDY